MPATTKPMTSRLNEDLLETGERKTDENKINPNRSPISKRPLSLAKSRNPDFRASTLYLRKKTLTECDYRLKITEDGRDMSELVEELMVTWLSDPTA